MKKLTTFTSVAFLLIGTLFLASGCKKKPPTTTQEAQPPIEAPAVQATPVAPPSQPQTERDPSAQVLAMSLEELNREGYLKDVYFDYDQAELRPDAREMLSSNSEWLKRFDTMQVLVEGHCDDRGTNAYNLALGERRANAAREYLISLGIDGSRVRTVSYGEERPTCTEQDESCWQQNRRDHFVITAK